MENIVNDKIDAFLPVTTDIVSLKEASSTGAIGLFDEKYGDDVRVVSMGDFSKELCGGIHVKNTGQIGALKIISESGVASGIRRITAISGRALLERANGYEEVINGAARALKSKPEHLTEKIEQMRAENLDFRHKLESVRAQSLNTVSDELVREAKDVNGVRLITKLFEGYTADDLRRISDDIKAKNDNIALVLATKADGRLMFLVSLTDDVVAKGYHAGRMIKQIAAAAGGGGGGKADMAQAGAKDASKAEEALSIAEKLM